MHRRLGLRGTPGVRESCRRSGNELVDLEVEFFGARARVEIDFLVAVLASALERLVLACTANDAEREHFEERQDAEVAEQAEVLLPGGTFGQDGEGAFEDGLGLQQVIAGHGDEFVVGGEVVHEVHHVALEVVGVAKEYEFHVFTYGLKLTDVR